MIGARAEELSETVGAPDIVRVPGWERYPWLCAGFSTRLAGNSSVYGAGELNLGWTKEDDPEVVKRNRAAFVRAVAEDAPMSLATVGQVHSAVVKDLDDEPEPYMTDQGKARLEGDGLISRRPGRLLAVLTADCTPVLVADTRNHAVGAFHAGWRGTLGRIAERGIAAMQSSYGSRAEDLIAAIGPCIGACCFEVGEEVFAAFRAEFLYAEELFQRGSPENKRMHMDLVEANRRQLLDAGLRPENVTVTAQCTACTRLLDGRRKFYSHRSEHGVTGRMLSAIGATA